MPVVRLRQGGGGAAGERGLTSRRPGQTSDESGALLRPALELAWAVARAGEQLRPAVPAPRPLRPFLDFAKLPARALNVVRRVVDDDEDFRARVVAAAEDVELARPARLFLSRPEGWSGELDGLMAAASAEIEDRHEDRDRRDVIRRVRAAEEAVRRAEDGLAAERERAVRAAEELRIERRSRRSAEKEAATARRSADSLAASEARARRELAEATDDLARLRAASDGMPDLEGLAGQVEDAAEAAASLASALRATAASLGRREGSGEKWESEAAGGTGEVEEGRGTPGASARWSEPVPSPVSGGSTRASAPSPARHQAPSPSPAFRTSGRRRPAALPPGVRDDSVEAAEHLVRLARVVVVVDGYNASIAWRPDLPIAEQRRRLVDALEELAARTQSDVEAVFDGAEPAPLVVPTGSRRLVRVRFSPPEVEADDVVVSLVEDLPRQRPVVVASNDRAVQERSQRAGANTISVAQLMAVLRRER